MLCMPSSKHACTKTRVDQELRSRQGQRLCAPGMPSVDWRAACTVDTARNRCSQQARCDAPWPAISQSLGRHPCSATPEHSPSHQGSCHRWTQYTPASPNCASGTGLLIIIIIIMMMMMMTIIMIIIIIIIIQTCT